MARLSSVQVAFVLYALLASAVHVCVASSSFATGGGPRVAVAKAYGLGNMTDRHLIAKDGLPLIPSRDCGAVGSVGGKIVWFFCDTEWFYNNTWNGVFIGNSGAIGNQSNPLLLNGPERQAIPFTEDESAWNTKYNNNPRVVLWPQAGPVEITPGLGLMWVPKGYYNAPAGFNVTEPNIGAVCVAVTIGSDGYANVTRLGSEPMFTKPAYGQFQATKDETFVYLYSSGDDIFVARALLGSATNVSAYEYWDAELAVWSTTQPLLNETKKAVMTNSGGIEGSVFYSTYHKAWLMILNYALEGELWVYSALAPQGPFVNRTLIYDAPDDSVGYIYGVSATNLYDPTGHSAIAQFTWTIKGGYDNWVVQIDWNVTATSADNQTVSGSSSALDTTAYASTVLAVILALYII